MPLESKPNDTLQSSDQNLIEDQAENFPSQMLMIPSLFEFSYIDAHKVLSKSVSSNADLITWMTLARDFVGDSDLDADLKADVVALIEGEVDVLAYSQTARCSVITM